MGGRLILMGAGSFGRELINWTYNAAEGGSAFSGYIDANMHALDKDVYDLPWLGTLDDYQPEEGDRLVPGIADPAVKRTLVEKMRAKGASFASLVHPTAVVARTAVLGEGVVLCPHSLVSADARIGAFVAVNALSSVGHDVVIGDYTTLSGHVDLTGFVQVGEACFFGTGAKVLPNVKVGKRAKIGAGSTIMRTVPDDAVMFVLPAKKL